LKKALLAAGLAIALYTVMVLASDLDRVGGAITRMDPAFLPLLVLLPLANYFLRFLKWQYFLRRVSVMVPAGRSLQVFLSGFAMTVSPGKFGELLKCVLLRDGEGIPVSTTSPVVVAERLTDLMSMILIAGAGVWLAGGRAALPAVAAGIVFVAAAVFLLSSRKAFALATRILCARGPLASKRDGMCSFRENCSCLLDAPSMLVTVPLGVLSWGIEAMVLVVSAGSMGLHLGPGLALLAHSAGSVAGAVSMIPGGLGLTEITIGGLLGTELALPDATAVTIVTRLATLWFAVALGAVVLWTAKRRPRRSAPGGPGAGSGSTGPTGPA